MVETAEFAIIHNIVVIADTTVGAALRVGPVAKAHTQVRPYRIAPICKGAIDRAAGGLIPASGGELG
ncbi:MAG: hypothetical protein QOF64_1797 [Candidatus Binatota bacterium]|nr:hypothetical protein [Candidatus Binatota bacterium]